MRKPDRYRILDEVDVAESADAWLRNRKSEVAEEERIEIVKKLMSSMDAFASDGSWEIPEVPAADEAADTVENVDIEASAEDTRAHREKGFHYCHNCKELQEAS